MIEFVDYNGNNVNLQYKNKLVNGDFQCWQRQTTSITINSTTESTTGYKYFADMWFIYFDRSTNQNFTFTKTDNGVKCILSTNTTINQCLEKDIIEDGKKCIFTASINNNIYSLNFIAGINVSNSYLQYMTTTDDKFHRFIINVKNNDVVNYAAVYDGNVLYTHIKEDYTIALNRVLPYVEYGEFAVDYNNDTYFVTGFTYKAPKRLTPIVIKFIKPVVDANGELEGTFTSLSHNRWSAPFIRYNNDSATGKLYNRNLNMRVLITCEPYIE